MKIKVTVNAASRSYLMYFDSYGDAQDVIAEFLQKYFVVDLHPCCTIEQVIEVAKHYKSEFERLANMPYFCENENGIYINDFKNRQSYEVEIEKIHY